MLKIIYGYRLQLQMDSFNIIVMVLHDGVKETHISIYFFTYRVCHFFLLFKTK